MLADRVRIGSYKDNALKIPDYYVRLADSDIRYIAFTDNHSYQGTEEYIIIPSTHQGNPIKLEMFLMGAPNIKGVAYDGDVDLNVSGLFNNYYHPSRDLDLRYFDISHISSLSELFFFAGANSIDISTWNLSHVADMTSFLQGESVGVIYVRSETDADIIRNSSGFPSSQQIIVK